MPSDLVLGRLIHGQIARVLNSHEVAINRGQNDGVQKDMLFDILDPISENIKDPESGVVLGSIPRPKVRVKVTRVEEKLCLASTYRTRRVNIGGTAGPEGGLMLATGFARALMPEKWVEEQETLKTQEKTWESIDEKESYVQTGDPVVQVIPVEQEATG